MANYERRYPLTTESAGKLSAHHWSTDPAGLAKHVRQILRRAKALTDQEAADLRAALDSREAARALVTAKAQ